MKKRVPLGKERPEGNREGDHGERGETEEDELVERLPEFCYAIISGTRSEALEGVRNVRDLLSFQGCKHISTVIDCGIVPRLVEFLGYESNPEIQYESAWALSNIAYGTKEQTDVIVKADCVPHLLKIISPPLISSSLSSSSSSSSSSSAKVDEQQTRLVEQAIWCLGNVLSDGRENIRLWCLQNGIIQGLSRFIELNARGISSQSEETIDPLRYAAWLLSLLSKSTDSTGAFGSAFQISLGDKYLSYLISMLPLVCKLMKSKDPEILCNACAAAYNLTLSSRKPNIFDNAVASDIPALLSAIFDFVEAEGYPDYPGDFYLYIVRVAGNITSGNVLQTNRAMTPSIMRSLYYLANSVTSTLVKKEIWWGVSNMAAGDHSQIQSVLDFGLVELAVKSCFVCPFAIKQECFYVLCNIVTDCTLLQLDEYLAIPRSVEALCESLDMSYVNPLLTLALKAVRRILEYGSSLFSSGSSPNPVRIQIEKAGGLEKIEKLQSLDDDKIFEAARNILLRYFDAPAVPDFVPDVTPSISPRGQSFLFSR